MKTASSRRLALLVAVITLITGIVLAQAVAATLAVSHNETWGDHLVDAEGYSVYLYVLDEGGTSTCVDACTNNWPPVTLPEGTEPTVADGLDQSLIGTIQRPNGDAQVTYGGHPLYRFRRDSEPGHTRGQGLGGQFYLVSAAGEPVMEQTQAEVAALPEEEMEALMAAGQLVFRSNCAPCHGDAGQGGIGPAFVGNGRLTDTVYIVNRVLDGFIEHGMPPFGGVLDDHQIAAVTTFIRNSWGNEFGAVLEEEVSAER